MKMEKWDLYNAKREKSGITVCRGEIIQKGLYHLSVSVWIVNQKGQYLLSQRHPKKQYPLYWECTGGSVLSGILITISNFIHPSVIVIILSILCYSIFIIIGYFKDRK